VLASGPAGGHDGQVPSAPEAYLHGHHDSVLRSHRWRTAQNSAGYLLPQLDPAARVLDVGCGPGTITVGLAALVPGGEVVGIDSAEDVLALARQEAEQAGQCNVRFAGGDVYRLGYPAGTFDVVHAHQVLQHLAEPAAALREMRRVCRPGGLVAARDADYGGMLWYPEDPELDEWRDLYRRAARASGGEPDAGRRLLAWAHDAGLTEALATASSWCYASPEDRAWWGTSWAERVTRSSFADRALEHGLASRADLDRLSRAWLRFAASDDGWFMVPSGEIRCPVPG
jgi:SAM-dependent methyltransferase